MDEHVGEVGCKCNVFFSDYLRQKKTIELRNQMFLTQKLRHFHSHFQLIIWITMVGSPEDMVP